MGGPMREPFEVALVGGAYEGSLGGRPMKEPYGVALVLSALAEASALSCLAQGLAHHSY